MNSSLLLFFAVYLCALLAVSFVWQWTLLPISTCFTKKKEIYAKFIDLKHERIIITFVRNDEWKLTFVILIIRGFLCILFARKNFPRLNWTRFPQLEAVCDLLLIGLWKSNCSYSSFCSCKCSLYHKCLFCWSLFFRCLSLGNFTWMSLHFVRV